MKSWKKKIIDFLISERLRRGLSHKDFGIMVGFPPETAQRRISYLEKTGQGLTLENLEMIFEKLGISLSDILGDVKNDDLLKKIVELETENKSLNNERIELYKRIAGYADILMRNRMAEKANGLKTKEPVSLALSSDNLNSKTQTGF